MWSLPLPHRLLLLLAICDRNYLFFKYWLRGCHFRLLRGHINIVLIVIDWVVNRPLEYGHICRLGSLDFWRLTPAQDPYNGNLLRLFGLLKRGVNWEFSYFLCIFIIFRFFLVTLVLWWEASFNYFRRYVLFNFAVKALSQRKWPHDPAGTSRAPAITLRPTPRGIDSRGCHFFLLPSRCIVDILNLLLGEMSGGV